jgi:hypothetical protein
VQDLHVLHAQILKDAEQVVDERVVERTVAATAAAATAAAAAAAAAVPGRSVRIASFQQSALYPRSTAHLPAHQHGANSSPITKAEQKL